MSQHLHTASLPPSIQLSGASGEHVRGRGVAVYRYVRKTRGETSIYLALDRRVCPRAELQDEFQLSGKPQQQNHSSQFYARDGKLGCAVGQVRVLQALAVSGRLEIYARISHMYES